LRHGVVVVAQAGVEQFPHAGLDHIGKFAGHDDEWLAFGHGWSSSASVQQQLTLWGKDGDALLFMLPAPLCKLSGGEHGEPGRAGSALLLRQAVRVGRLWCSV
jgi:hypothetical protein